ncbi:alpha/beta hydrolase [Actinotalea sp. K2]|uniref:alpha/beta hydrolase n=1 Tax=Actinotalea sp. K2 TaxID=2939438 RepID=UPI002016D807|nr:alpha/beta hydrolase [Actinotalea sp. K2]MCL3859673.1 alpha/beta hydrolase [Actinotalea sp. K2]
MARVDGGANAGRRGPVGVLVAVVVVVVLLVVVLWLGQRTLIYFPDTSRPGSAADMLPGGQDVLLTTQDGLELGAWYLPAPAACPTTVLVAPGNGGNRAGRAGLARAIGDRGLGVLLLDYRGYGGNPGRPSEQGLAHDARAAHAFLTGEAGVPEEALVYLGESIGTGVVTALAVDHPPAAMVLRSPFTSLADAGRAAYGVPLGWVLRDHFPVARDIAATPGPLAVVLGSGDTIVPAALSREVAQTARAGGLDVLEVEVEGADHNDLELSQGPALLDALVEVSRRATSCP